VKNHK